MAYETIRVDVVENIQTITLHRPEKLNAFTRQMMQELMDAFGAADADDSVRAVIVTGAGRAFCAGADLSGGAGTFGRSEATGRPQPRRLADGRADYSDAALRDGGGRVTLRIFDCLKPVIGAINGPAVGIGATMLLPMDVRIAAQEARFGFVFARRGIVMEAASSWFLPRIVGPAQALEWCFSGRVFDADEALRGRLVSRVVAGRDLLPAARALAREIADNNAPVSVALMRQMIWRMLGADHPIEAHKIDSRGMFNAAKARTCAKASWLFLKSGRRGFPTKYQWTCHHTIRGGRNAATNNQ